MQWFCPSLLLSQHGGSFYTEQQIPGALLKSASGVHPFAQIFVATSTLLSRTRHPASGYPPCPGLWGSDLREQHRTCLCGLAAPSPDPSALRHPWLEQFIWEPRAARSLFPAARWDLPPVTPTPT